MTSQETTRFEIYVRSRGYQTEQQSGRYCEGIVNLLKDAWSAAQNETPAMRGQDAPEQRRAASADSDDDHCGHQSSDDELAPLQDWEPLGTNRAAPSVLPESQADQALPTTVQKSRPPGTQSPRQ